MQSLLEQSESEKRELQSALDEAQKMISETQHDLVEQKQRADLLKTHITAFSSLTDSMVALDDTAMEAAIEAEIANETDPDKRALLELKKNLRLNERKYAVADVFA